MRAYTFKAALVCEYCGKLAATLADQAGTTDTGDSDDYPQGPSECGESDSPQHCDACGLFLENPLTNEGRLSLVGVLKNALTHDVAHDWLSFYAPHVADLDESLDDWFKRRTT